MNHVTRLLARTVLCALLVPALAGTFALAQSQREFTGRTEAPPPPRNDAGDWNGTWIYANRDVHVAMWIRTTAGRPEIKLRYRHLSTAEGFETDWTGHASYQHEGWPATFDLTLGEADPNTFSGTWNWVLTRDTSTRTETARISGWRTLDGRQLVLKFDDFLRRITIGERNEDITADYFWTFRKAARRLALWDELPF
jgi:hypothetical protein